MNNLTTYNLKSNIVGYSITIENKDEVLDLIINDIINFTRNKNQIQLVHNVHGDLILNFKTEQHAIDSYDKLESAINLDNITTAAPSISDLYFTYNIYDSTNVISFPCLVFTADKTTQMRSVAFQATSSSDLITKLNTKYNGIGTFVYNGSGHYLTMTYTEDVDSSLLPQAIQFLDSYTSFSSSTTGGNITTITNGENYIVTSAGTVLNNYSDTITTNGFKWYYSQDIVEEMTFKNFANLTVSTSSRTINEINKINLFSTVLLGTSNLNKNKITSLYFNSVTTLASFDFANLVNLKTLNTYACVCSNPSFLNFADCINLETFYCTYTSITDIDLSMANIHLFNIQGSYNIDNLTINNCKEINIANCYHFTGDNFSINGNVEKLSIFRNNQMTALPEFICNTAHQIILFQTSIV